LWDTLKAETGNSPETEAREEFRVKYILKYIHVKTNWDIKKEMEDLGYIVTNILNIKKQGTKKAFHMSELKTMKILQSQELKVDNQLQIKIIR
jgi:uncharacterized protein YebE (UPF0316 family)